MTNNSIITRPHNNTPLIDLEHRRQRPRRARARLAVFTVSAVALAACGSSDATAEPSPATVMTTVASTSAPAAPPSTSTTAAPTGPFRSALYGYEVTALDWTGRSATSAWDGTGSPGSGDPTVDVLQGPNAQQAYGFGGPTTSSLDDFVSAGRVANAKTHGCPVTPDVTERIIIGGEPAIIDEVDCGVFALSATAIHAGRVYAFFTFDQPGKEDEMRAWFRSLMQTVAFDTA